VLLLLYWTAPVAVGLLAVGLTWCLSHAACRPVHVQVCDMLILANNQSSAKSIARVKSQAQQKAQQ
jgi:hypothetical protein